MADKEGIPPKTPTEIRDARRARGKSRQAEQRPWLNIKVRAGFPVPGPLPEPRDLRVL